MKEGLTPSKIDQLLAKIKPRRVVVLVDDDPGTLDLLERTLRDDGCEVHRLERAEDLVKQFSKIHPDVLVMEAVLPGMSGLSVLEELRPQRAEDMIPVLILSKRDDLRAKLLAFRRGAWDYVTKPFEAEEVAARVRTLIRSKTLQQLLQLSSISDPLTALYNRRFLLSWLKLEMERLKRHGIDLSCLLIDLDGFRRINEQKGERFGDFLLREFALFLSRHTRASDIRGRLENDKFLLFLPATPREGAIVAAHRLRQLAAARSFEREGKRTQASFCLGVISARSSEPIPMTNFLEKAEEALAKAKAVGEGETAVL